MLRRLIRRALRFATLMGVNEPFMHKVARKVTEVMGDAYPELTEHADFIARAVHEEEQRFSLTLQKGLELLDEELAALKTAGKTQIPGEFCFKLYDTYGFPLDIVTDVAEKRGFTADAAGFEKHISTFCRTAAVRYCAVLRRIFVSLKPIWKKSRRKKCARWRDCSPSP